MRPTDRRLVVYVVAVFTVSYALQAAIWLRGGIDSPTFERLAPIVMFVPGLTALAFLWRRPGGWRSIAWGVRRPRYVIYAALLPAIMALLLVGVITWAGLADSPHLALNQRDVVVSRGLFVLGRGEQSVPFFLLNVALSAVALGILNGLVTVGEEVGWRGYLQPGLLSQTSFRRAIIIVGLVWAHWHTPVILMGYNYPETPVLGALVLWPLTCVCWSFVAAWLSIRADSIWPAVVLHGSVNAFLGGLVDGLTYLGPRLPADLIVLSLWAVLAGVAYRLAQAPAQPARPVVGSDREEAGRALPP